MKTYDIGVIGGDGIGPEVTAEATKVLRAVADRRGFSVRLHHHPLGGEHFMKTGELVSGERLRELAELDSVLLGAVGHPDVKPGVLEQGILLKMRFDLDLYINLRPVKLLPGVPCPLAKAPVGLDFVVVRENTEGLYAGAGGFLKKGTADEVATQESINTRKGVERCVRYAFDVAARRERKLLTLCGKTNVLTYAWDLWERTFNEVAREYDGVKTEYQHVDALSMFLLMNPDRFDVIVTDNMFGDIVTDAAAMLQGGLGLAPSGNIHPGGAAIFEPVHGSAPQFTGKGVVNPLAAIASVQMMLEHLGENGAAADIERATIATIPFVGGMNIGEMKLSTSEVGGAVIAHLADAS
ncbi:3-isopropylmalate dehydrogenase [bacterium]|nr:3-isopropylmalate dehydrogenase [bacterium]